MSGARVAAARGLAAAARAAVFDMDGTLVDTEPLYRDAFLAAGRAMGVSVPDALHDSLVGLSSRDRVVPLLAAFGADFPVLAFFAEYKQRKAAVLRGAIPLRPHALAVLAALHAQGVPCAVATSATRRTAEAVLGRAGLLRHLGAVVTRDDVEHGKPHPQTHLLAAERLGVEPGACLALEDSAPGLIAAHAAGMATVAAGAVPPGGEIALLCCAAIGSFAELHLHTPQWRLPRC